MVEFSSYREQKVGFKGTFENRGHRLCGAEGVCVGEGPLPRLTDGLYSEAVAAGLRQPLHLVGVAGSVVNGHEPAQERSRRGR